MPTTFKVFSLGTDVLIDSFEGSANSENAAALVGNTYGSAGSPLFDEIKTLSEVSNGGVATSYDTDNNNSNDTFSIDGGAAQTFDGIAVYDTTVTYADGTTDSISAVVFQDKSGNLYLAPEFSQNADQDVLEAKAIQSLTFNSLTTADSNMTSSRVDGNYVTPDDTVDGTTGDDFIGGGYVDAQGDAVDGNDGDDDLIQAGAGQDTVDGGAGDDTIDGGAGLDSIIGGVGNDSIDGSAGNDTIYGGVGDDSISGGADQDQIFGGEGADTLDGGADNDTIEGGEGADSILGGDGADSITAGNGNDTVYAGAGDDTIDLTSTFSNNLAYGGDGNDLFITDNGADTIYGESGNDTIDGGLDYGTQDPDELHGGDGDDVITSGFAGTTGLTIRDSLYGDAGADTLIGGTANDYLDGGTDNDSITGGAGDDIFTYTVGDGNDTISDFNTGNTGTLGDGDSTNNDFIDLSPFYDNLSELYADQADDGILNQSNTTDTKGRSTDYSDNSEFGAGSLLVQGASADNSSFTQENTGVVCFTSGTAIRTPQGDVLIDDLKVGDLVTTMDNGPQRICWIGRRDIGHSALKLDPKLRPVLIPKGVLGAKRPLLVSRQHGMMVNDDHLMRAIHLTGTDGVRVANGRRRVCYIHLMFDAHQVIFAENTPAESFYPGPFALEMFDRAVKHSFLGQFPELMKIRTSRPCIQSKYGNTAREFITEAPRH